MPRVRALRWVESKGKGKENHADSRLHGMRELELQLSPNDALPEDRDAAGDGERRESEREWIDGGEEGEGVRDSDPGAASHSRGVQHVVSVMVSLRRGEEGDSHCPCRRKSATARRALVEA